MIDSWGRKNKNFGVVFMTASLLLASVFLPGQVVRAEDEAVATVSADIGQSALAYARRYVETEYVVDGERRQGVAYLWGGRMSVEQYIEAVHAGAAPGVDAGVDASAVVVQSYLAVLPHLRFASANEEEVQEATSSTLYHFNVVPISVDELRPGDLIFFKDEDDQVSGVALFERREGPNVHFIIASARAGRVIRTFYNVNNDSWKRQFKGAGRLLNRKL